MIGLFLFLFVLVSNFTGYLLPWDQLAFWAVTICTGMMEYLPGLGHWLQDMVRGGEEVGPATLSVFFTIHVVIMPLCLFLLMPFHFWRVRRAGGVVIPSSSPADSEEKDTRVPTVPNLVIRELVVGLVLIACIMVYSLIFDAPLEAKANPGLSPNPTKAPWYFIGVQEMLMHFHPFFAAWLIPILIVISLAALPYFRYDAETAGVWFCSQKGRRMGVVAAITALALIPLAILCDEFLMDLSAWLPEIPGFGSSGLLAVVVLFAAMVAFYICVKKRYAAANNEAIQAVFILLLVAYIILTVTGYWFRGEGMALTWPWKVGLPGP